MTGEPANNSFPTNSTETDSQYPAGNLPPHPTTAFFRTTQIYDPAAVLPDDEPVPTLKKIQKIIPRLIQINLTTTRPREEKY